MDVLFERGVPARKFKSTVVDQFSGDTLEVVEEGTGSDEEKRANVEHSEKV